MFKKVIISIVIFFGIITFAQSETSWIKKKDNTKKTEKLKKEKASWIKKKNDEKKEEIIENKKELKEKIIESKSWITKKSKEQIKDIKEKLKKHKTIDQLPDADFYFAAIIEPKGNEKIKYFYGYVNSDKTSELFTFK